MPDLEMARKRLESFPAVPLAQLPSPVDDLSRLREALGLECRLLAKREDQIAFGFGGNKIRKLTLVAAEASGADLLITCGGVQSNHCRATAAVAARLGVRCHIVVNGSRPERPTGNALLVSLYGAHLTYVATRAERAPAMERIAAEHSAIGGKPAVIPLGASTATGAMAIARGVGEMVAQGVTPDVIVHASSSGGTQAGLIAGCALYAPDTRVIGISADDPAGEISGVIRRLLSDMESALDAGFGALGSQSAISVDDAFVGGGYGVPTPASTEAQQLAARHEAMLLDHWYTAKAKAALIDRARRGEFTGARAVLFWHTGGQPGALA